MIVKMTKIFVFLDFSMNLRLRGFFYNILPRFFQYFRKIEINRVVRTKIFAFLDFSMNSRLRVFFFK